MKKGKEISSSSCEQKSSIRKNRLTIMLNDRELRVLERYERTYMVKNRSKFVRGVLLSAILSKLEEDAPTLF